MEWSSTALFVIAAMPAAIIKRIKANNEHEEDDDNNKMMNISSELVNTKKNY